MPPRRGFLLTVEGVDGSGKSTQMGRIVTHLRRSGYRVTVVREPGGTALAERIRRWLLDSRKSGLAAPSELFLYLAARAQLYADKIEPALSRGELVLCDRFTDSTLAYQGFGRGFAPALLRELNDLCTQSRRPDLTLFLDLPLSVTRARRNSAPDRMESEKARFFRRVVQGYRRLAKIEPGRVVTVDASGTRALVFEQIRQILDRRLGSVRPRSRSTGAVRTRPGSKNTRPRARAQNRRV
jgi:dTMP kinase